MSADGNALASRPAFVTSVVPETTLGLNPTKKYRARVEPKPKGYEVTRRHKQWLAQFQEQRSQLMQMLEQKAQRIEQNRKKFTAKSQSMRDTIRHSNEEEEEVTEQSYASESGAPAVPVEDKVPSQSAPRKKDNRPAWARTQAQQEQAEEDEASDLLDFASGLDYDKYLHDSEVHEALELNRGEVAKAEAEMRTEAERATREAQAAGQIGLDEEYYFEEDLSDRPITASTFAVASAASNKKYVRKLRKKAERSAEDEKQWDPILKSEQQMLKEAARPLRSIHSTASVKAMMSTQQTEAFSSTVGLAATDSVNTPASTANPLPQPTIVAHLQRTLPSSPNPSNLPFLYRHPGI